MLNIITVMMFLFAAPALAEVKIEEIVLQKGVFASDGKDWFEEDECQKTKCFCKADINYFQVTGLKDPQKQAFINQKLKKAGEKLQCTGKKLDKTFSLPDDYSSYNIESRGSFHWITCQSPEFLSFFIESDRFSGGAHPTSTMENAYIIDLNEEKIVTLEEMFDTKALPELTELLKKADEKFFIREDDCYPCNVILGTQSADGTEKEPLQKGLFFTWYESSGLQDIFIPSQYIRYAPLKKMAEALEQESASSKTEKPINVPKQP